MAGSWNISLFIVLYGQALCSTRLCLKMGKLGTKKAFVKKTENHKVYSLVKNTEFQVIYDFISLSKLHAG